MPRRYAMVLALSSMFSFGTHVAYKSLSGVSSFLEADLSTDSVGFGVLNSAVSWSALACAPFVTGVLTLTLTLTLALALTLPLPLYPYPYPQP